MPNGDIVLDAGDGPCGGVTQLLREAVAAMFTFPHLPRLYLAGPSILKVGSDIVVDEPGTRQRVWAFRALDPEDGRLFVWQTGLVMGIGRTQEEVEEAVRMLGAACKRRARRARDLQRNAR